MSQRHIWATAVESLMVFVMLMVHQALAQAATPYPTMAPIDQYLMEDRTTEIDLARSAAPISIARDAEILVLAPHGFETAVKGKNGFVCIVERSWTSAPDADFWNPKVRTPICYNAPAARSALLRNLKRTDLILAGSLKAHTDEAIVAAVDRKELPAMEPGAMCYMMSKKGFGGDNIEHWPSHLMFFYPQTDAALWGAGLPGSPILAYSDPSEHATTFVVVVPRWSDGTEALWQPKHHVHR